MTVKIKVYSDFVCAFCFLGTGPLDEVVKEKDIEVEWMPFELRPSPSPKIDPRTQPRVMEAWNSFIYPTAKKLGLEIKLPHLRSYTHLAFEGYQFAKEHGKGNEFHQRVFIAHFQEEQSIEDIEVLTKLAEEVGLSQDAFKEALVSRKYREMHQEALRHAHQEAQIMAVPTFIIGDEVIQGFTSKEKLAKAIDQEIEKNKKNELDGLQCSIDGAC
ncbi:DsbA family oxidoreductase [Bacillus pseudomycoides]|uniref:DsbA family oxidoreductase n=1 Tax=Bacillus TaxID=1386 RepID=UPI002248930F|nr:MULTISPECIES: DsbA family oxidoreductase [Bacillus]MCX2826105.1 DsbA family oxidoreductase [Bacillus sp. DHT2]MDR4913779.1 DsbA family oxidoreductase [Bacillus pseudomycoides]